jgi:flagellar basal-body rod modification protein FlgD
MISTDVLDAAGAAGSVGTTAPPSTLGRDEFLQMLIAQLENQDPLNPQDATQFTAQLAQFSSLEQLISIEGRLESLAETEGVSQRLGAAGLIGRHVVAEGTQLSTAADGVPLVEPLLFLAGNSSATTVRVYDASGRLVRALELGALAQGEHAVAWDGLDASGSPLPAGVYEFSVSAFAGDQPVEVTSLVQGRVTGAVPTAGEPLLMVGNVAVPLSRVTEVGESRRTTP